MPLASRTAGLAAVFLALPAPLAAQDFVGAPKCFGCHKQARKAAQDSHGKALTQLSDPKAAQYAAATGGDAKHPKCIACHAPVALAAGPAGVSCETCHGPAKGYLAPHQEADFYAQPAAQWKGLRNLKDNAKEIARMCVVCHVVDDKAIVAAGHPSGADFDAGRDMAKPAMVHWPSGSVGDARVRAYTAAFYAAVTREGAPIVASRAAAGGGGKRAAAPLVKTGAPGAPAAAPPLVKTRVPAPAPGKPPAADDEYADLGDDEFVAAPAPKAQPTSPISVAAPPPAPPRPIERLALADPPTGEFAKAPVRIARAPAAPAAPPPPSTSATPPRATATPARPTPAPVATPAPAPTGPVGPVELRGRAALVLADLLRQKKKLDIPAPAPAAEFAGPDGELLRLQDEILALALESLRRVP